MSERNPVVVVAFDSPEDLLAAVLCLRARPAAPSAQQGLLERALSVLRLLNRPDVVIEAYTPHPLPALETLLGRPPSRLPIVFLVIGILGTGGGYMLQLWGSRFYPLNIGGRPINSWPAFGNSTFEIGLLAALIFGYAGYLLATGLTRLHDPIFAVPGFTRAAQDRYLLHVRGRTRAEIEALLGALAPRRITEIDA